MKDHVILIEFNELCPPLLQKWMAAGILPNFKKFYDNSHAFVTKPCVPEQQYLEPWIQWFSLHTGLSYDQHKVFHLADGPRANVPSIWSVLANAGISVGNCGSMNAAGFNEQGSYFLPDPWCTSEQASPAELQSFHDFVSYSVREYTNSSPQLSYRLYTDFLKFMLTHGLTAGTILAIIKQLAQERIIDRRQSWKRAAILDKLQFDVFAHYHKSISPEFSTFFANSTAHLQHAYWRNMEPEVFDVQPTDEEQGIYANAIQFGYTEMDALIGRFMKLESENTTLILSTGHSQQPFLKGESIGGQRFYRPQNIENTLNTWGVDFVDAQSTMTHQFQIRFANSKKLVQGKEILESIRCDGEPLFGFNKSENDSIYMGCSLHREVKEDSQIVVEGKNNTVNFYDLFYMIDATKSGFHHPDGILWIKNNEHKIYDEKVSVLDVFPTLLESFSIPLPKTQKNIYRGKSLLPLINTANI